MTIGLQDIEIKKSYDSDEDNILEDFYIPALSKATSYDRLVGFFSSTSLAAAAKGIHRFVKNGGKMRMVTSVYLSSRDIQAIKEGIKGKSDIIQRNLLAELVPTEDEFTTDHLKALAWMITHDRLKIRIAVFKNEGGDMLPSDHVFESGIFHQKVGILRDTMSNSLSFSGSDNESLAGWEGNIEEFKVFRQWVDDESEYFRSDDEKFNKFWSDRASRVDIMELPEAVRRNIIKMSPQNFENIKLERHYTPKRREVVLRDYQQQAIQKWLKNGKKGVLSIATGCGKTLTGICALMHALNQSSGLAVISAPTRIICKQWLDDLKSDVSFQGVHTRVDKVLLCYSGTGWEKKIADILHHIENQRIKNAVFIVTSTSLGKLINYLKGQPKNQLLIGDEVHSLGSEKNAKLLETIGNDSLFSGYLGLSATPERFYDSKGTDSIHRLFGKVVFEYSLRNAIDSGHLAKYNYHLNFVKLTQKELYDYRQFTKKIGRNMAMKKSLNDDEGIDFFVLKRAKILKKASGKVPVLRSIFSELDSQKKLQHTIVFCEDKLQLAEAANVLKDLNVFDFSQITEDVSEDYRDIIIEKFKQGMIQVILSINIFNEGVDIKQARTTVVLSSTTNPREYIQRRGRVLRKEETKQKTADIYDFIIYTDIKLIQKNKLENSLVHKELDRISYFAKDAANYHKILDDPTLIELVKATKFTGLF